MGPEDLAIRATWHTDRELIGLLSGHPEYAYATVEEAVAANHQWWDRRLRETDSEQWAILGPGGALIGAVDLHDLAPTGQEGEGAQRRRANLIPEIGPPDCRGRGLGSEAMALLVRRAFEDLGQAGFEVEVLEDNPRARRAFEKLGFIERGRRQIEPGGPRWVVLVLDREDWARPI